MIELRMPAGVEAARSLTQIKLIAMRFPGEHELSIVVSYEHREHTGTGAMKVEMRDRTLTLGPVWMYDGSPACMAALGEFGAAELAADR